MELAMNEHEASRIAAAMHQLRPDWPASSVLTIIRKNLMDRPRRDVTVALSWIACEANSHTPARVLETGPWWRAAGVEGTAFVKDNVAREERCSVCSMPMNACRLRAHDHEFESMAEAAKRKSATTPATVTHTIAALKGALAPTKPPKPRAGLEELADRDPKLRARVDAVRAQLPKGPPMREVEDIQPERADGEEGGAA